MIKRKYKLLNMLEEKGSNQKQLADLLGVGYTCIQNKVSGKSDFKTSEIAKIKAAYNLTLEEVEEIFLKD